MEQLEQLKRTLYRKHSLEHTMNVLKLGGVKYSNYLGQIKKRLAEKGISAFEKAKLEKEFDADTWICRNFIQSFKECEREYNYYILPAVEEMLEQLQLDKTSEQFINCNELAKDLASQEIYGKTSPQPENVENLQIIDNYEKIIDITKRIIKGLNVRIEKCKDDFDKAKMERELFDSNLQLVAMEKRLAIRKEYYYNVFLPKFNVEFEQAKIYLSPYLDRAKEFVRLGIDPKLTHLLNEYEKHKTENEKLWLFFTALKTRVDQIIEFVELNPDLHEGKMHLAQKIS